ncbi:MAG: DUF4426 domain-containing protein [Thiobacillaceae bacterium]|jgi:Domain of unknown function (DUF4426)
MKCWLAMLAVVLIPAVAHAEKAEKFGNIEVHYNAMLTTDLLPEVARAYKIDRSETRGLVTISVLRKNAMGVGIPIPAKLSVYAVNLVSQLSTVDMREIKEGNAIYYLGEFRVVPPDTLKFHVTVKATGEPNREVTFGEQFYR